MIIDPGSPDLALERVELAFPDLVPGFEVVERRVRFDGRDVADLLATAGERTLLVTLVGEDEDASALRGLDALSFARTQRDLLARYLDTDVLPGGAPEVVLVATSFSTRLRARLAALGDAGDFWLVTRHELSTSRGSSTRLEVVGAVDLPERLAEVTLPAWATESPLRDFLACIAPDRLALGLEVLERLRRIDPELEWSAVEPASLVCSWRGTPICELDWIDGHLELQLGDGSTPHALRDLDAVEFVLDWVLTAFLEVAESVRERDVPSPLALERPAPTSGPAPIDRQPDLLDASPDDDELEPLEDDPDADGEPSLRQVELRPAPPGPILTREELEAFRD